MGELCRFEFRPPTQQEYELTSLPSFKPRRFRVIGHKRAKELYFNSHPDGTNVFVINGGQKGDEGKGKGTKSLFLVHSTLEQSVRNNIRWTLAPNSTHNAGKGIHTLDEQGQPVRLSFHLCPATIVDPEMKNYIGPNAQMNPFKLEEEVSRMREATGRNRLGENYHLMVDANINLLVPVNRAEDVVCKPNAMGSTISGATAALRYARGKAAPLLEHVLYDHDQFRKHVTRQIRDFDDLIKHDEEFAALGINDMRSLGVALRDERKGQNDRLSALEKKLSDEEIDFFSHENPVEYLLEQYQRIATAGLFKVGDTRRAIREHIRKGEAGIIEGVQSVLLSGNVKYGKNRTAAATDSAGTIGDAGLGHQGINYSNLLVFKFANTSVGGNGKTMSGFIRQDQLSRLSAMAPSGQRVTFEYTANVDQFLSREQATQAFAQVNAAFHQAIREGYSLHHSKVRIGDIDCDFSLAEARALLSSYHWGETGETSKRARICRFDDMVETGVVYDVEGDPMIMVNAVDRVLDLDQVGIIPSYKVVGEYGGYGVGDIITPGMPLRQEHQTVAGCIPQIALMDSWSTLNENGTNELNPGDFLHPNLCQYLSVTSQGRQVIAIGVGPKETDVVYIEAA